MGLMGKVALRPAKQVGSAVHTRNQSKKDTSITFTIDKVALINHKAPLSRPPPLREAWGQEKQHTEALPPGSTQEKERENQQQQEEEEDQLVPVVRPSNPQQQVQEWISNNRRRVQMMKQLGLTREDVGMSEDDHSDVEDHGCRNVRAPSTVSEEQQHSDEHAHPNRSNSVHKRQSHDASVVLEARVKVTRQRGTRLKRAQSAKQLTERSSLQDLKRAASADKGLATRTTDRGLYLPMGGSLQNVQQQEEAIVSGSGSEDMQLLRILVPSTTTTARRSSAPKIITTSRPTPTLTSRAFISAIKDRKDNITVDDILAASGNQSSPEPQEEISNAGDSQDSSADEPKPRAKSRRPPPVGLNRFPKDDPRRKFYQRIKWKKKPAPDYEEYLPRTTFYSCHDRMLAAAGYDPQTLKPLRGATPMTRDAKTKDEADTQPKIPQEDSSKNNTKRRNSADQMRRKSLAAIAEDPIDDDYGRNKSLIMTYKPILDYLRLIRKQPQDYLALRKKLAIPSNGENRLVAMGEVFSKGQSQNKDADGLVVQAAYELSGKANHPLFTKYAKEESLKAAQALATSPRGNSNSRSKNNNKRKGLSYIRDLMKSISQGRGISEQKTREQQSGAPIEGAGQMESKWVKAELFARTLTTAQLIRVRDAALREMGNDSASIRRWWDANSDCQYLRIRRMDGHADDEDMTRGSVVSEGDVYNIGLL